MEKRVCKPLEMDTILVSKIAQDLDQKIANNHITNVTVLNSTDFLLSFSFFRAKKLLISINHNHPYLGLINPEENLQNLSCDLSTVLRKELRDSYLLKVEQVNEDRIIKFILSKLENDFLRHKKTVYLELIPHRPNLIIVDENNNVRFATHYEDDHSSRTIKRNEQYFAPDLLDHNRIEKEGDALAFYQLIEDNFSLVIKKRIAEKFASLFALLQKREKTLFKKEKIILDELKKANDRIVYQEYGNLLLSIEDEDVPNILEINIIPYDATKTRIANANHCFVIYKKAKRQIEFQNKELLCIKEEKEYLNHLKTQIEFANEDDISEINSLVMHKETKAKQKQNLVQKKINFIDYNGTKIFYGKSDKQNDELTFKFANFKHTFLHIHSLPGAHIIIAKENPSDEELLFGAEMALVLAKRDDGDVSYALVKDLKKGQKPGLVILKKYKTIHLSKIRETTLIELDKQKLITHPL